MSKPVKFLIVFVVSIPVLIALYFFENIQGYYKFKQYCEKEGGLKVYEKLDKNSGFLVDDKFDAMTVSHINNVKFARFPDKKNKGNFIDVVYKGGNPSSFKSFDIRSSYVGEPLKYRWKDSVGRESGELRLTRLQYEVFDIDKRKLMVSFNRFSYSKFDRNKTILAAPSGEGCHDIETFFKAEEKKKF